jgi:hypothetical protein
MNFSARIRDLCRNRLGLARLQTVLQTFIIKLKSDRYGFERLFKTRGPLIFTVWLSLVLICFSLGYRSYQSQKLWRDRVDFLDPQCRSSYQQLFSKEKIDIRIVFGYKDARPARFVGDRYERNALIEEIIKPCEPERFDCGFKRSAKDAFLFTKPIQGLAGNHHLLSLRIVNSSVGPDDEVNRQNPFQKWQSEMAQRNFIEGLSEADIIFYNGHSRDGGGPDFEPPKLTVQKHINYSWYKAHKKNLRQMHQIVQAGIVKPKIVGLFSCVSHRLLPSTRVNKNVAWLTSQKLVYYADALNSMRDALSALLGFSCQGDFDSLVGKKEKEDATISLFGFVKNPESLSRKAR